MKRTIIVDENDNEIGVKDDKNITINDIYRVSSLWVVNYQSEILFGKRSANRPHDPGKWAPAVNGTVEMNESYDSNIVKEAAEEIGIIIKDVSELIVGPKVRIHGEWNFFAQTYAYKTNQSAEDFIFDKREISELRFIDINKVEDIVKNNPNFFVKSLNTFYPLLVDWLKKI